MNLKNISCRENIFWLLIGNFADFWWNSLFVYILKILTARRAYISIVNYEFLPIFGKLIDIYIKVAYLKKKHPD